MRLETVARKIMQKMKGWRPKDSDEDFRDHPEAHRAELMWLVRELEKVQKIRTNNGPSKA